MNKPKFSFSTENQREDIAWWFLFATLGSFGCGAISMGTAMYTILNGAAVFQSNPSNSHLEKVFSLAFMESIGLLFIAGFLETLTRNYNKPQNTAELENIEEELRKDFLNITDRPSLAKLILPAVIITIALAPTLSDTLVHLFENGLNHPESVDYLAAIVTRIIVASPYGFLLLARLKFAHNATQAQLRMQNYASKDNFEPPPRLVTKGEVVLPNQGEEGDTHSDYRSEQSSEVIS